MRRVEKRTLFAGGLILASLAQAGLGGYAYYARQQADRSLTEARGRLQQLQLQSVAPAPIMEPAATETPPSWRLLDGPRVVETMQALQSVGESAGVEFEGQKALRADRQGKQAFQVTGHGTPVEVCRLLRAIETSERLMIVESGRILPATEQEIAFDLGVATYHGER